MPARPGGCCCFFIANFCLDSIFLKIFSSSLVAWWWLLTFFCLMTCITLLTWLSFLCAVHWTAVLVRHPPDSWRRLDVGHWESLDFAARLHDRHNERVPCGSEKRFRRRVIEATDSSAFVIVFVIGSHGWLRFFCHSEKERKTQPSPRTSTHRSKSYWVVCVRGVWELGT